MQVDKYFTYIDLSKNLLKDRSASWLAKLIEVNASALHTIDIRQNKMTDVGLARLKKIKKLAFRAFRRNWIILADGNQASMKLVQKLKLNLKYKEKARHMSQISNPINEEGPQPEEFDKIEKVYQSPKRSKTPLEEQKSSKSSALPVPMDQTENPEEAPPIPEAMPSAIYIDSDFSARQVSVQLHDKYPSRTTQSIQGTPPSPSLSNISPPKPRSPYAAQLSLQITPTPKKPIQRTQSHKPISPQHKAAPQKHQISPPKHQKTPHIRTSSPQECHLSSYEQPFSPQTYQSTSQEPQEHNAAVEIATNETQLDLSGRDIMGCPDINNVTQNLQRLSLSNNKIANIVGLPDSLVALDMSYNCITELFLENLTKLEFLDVSYNKIQNIKGFGQNRKIRELDLSGNKITVLKNLECLKSLERLNMEKNDVASKSSIRTLSLNSKLSFLVLRGNPIFIQAQYRATIKSMLPRVKILDYQRNGVKLFEKEIFFSEPILQAPAQEKLAKPRVQPKSHAKPRPNPVKTVSRLYQPKQQPSKPAMTQTTSMAPSVPKLTNLTNGNTSTSSLRRPQPVSKPVESAREVKYKASDAEEEARALDYLSDIYLFNGIPTSFIEASLGLCRRRRGSIGEILENEGDTCSNVSILLDGKIQHGAKELEPGAIIHPEALVNPTKLQQNLLCLDRSYILTISKKDFDLFLRRFPAYKEEITKNYQRRQKPRQIRRPQSQLSTGSKRSVLQAIQTPSQVSSKPMESPKNETFYKQLIATLEAKVDSLVAIHKEEVDILKSRHSPSQHSPQKSQTLDSRSSDRKSEDFQLQSMSSSPKRITQSPKVSLPLKIQLAAPLYDSPAPETLEDSKSMMTDYLRNIQHNESGVKEMLQKWVHDIQEDQDTCQLSMQNLLSGDHTDYEVEQYIEILNECDMLVQKSDPYPQIINRIGDLIYSDVEIKSLVEKVSRHNTKLNSAKQYMQYILDALRANDMSKLRKIREEAIAFGVIEDDEMDIDEDRPCVVPREVLDNRMMYSEDEI